MPKLIMAFLVGSILLVTSCGNLNSIHRTININKGNGASPFVHLTLPATLLN